MRKMERQGNISYVSDAPTGIRNVLANSKYTFTMDETEFLNDFQACLGCLDLVVLKERFNRAGLGVVLRQNMPYKLKMDQVFVY